MTISGDGARAAVSYYSLTHEIDRLRSIISACAVALGNGARISETASVEFCGKLPAEIAGVVNHLRAAKQIAAKAERDACAAIAGDMATLATGQTVMPIDLNWYYDKASEFERGRIWAAMSIAADIRARSGPDSEKKDGE